MTLSRILGQIIVATSLSCSDHPSLEVPLPPEAAAPTCTFWVCRGCVRRADEDFACRGHEFLIQAYECPVEFDLCKPNNYGGFCCYPPPGQD